MPGFGGLPRGEPQRSSPRGNGGDRIRTDDPLLAKQVLYQLSYAPAGQTLSQPHPEGYGRRHRATSGGSPSRITAREGNGPGRT